MTKTKLTLATLAMMLTTLVQAQCPNVDMLAEIDSIVNMVVDQQHAMPNSNATAANTTADDGIDVDYTHDNPGRSSVKVYENCNTHTTVQVDERPQRILLFGDSMLDGVGRRFQDYADQNGHSLYTSIWYGSTTHMWARTTELDRLMDKVKPTFVIISLGTNDLGYHDLQARSESVREILRVVGDIPYVWIGPAKLPKLNKDFGIVGMLRETIGMEHFYDSYNERLARFPDNIHPTFAASAVWIDKVVDWMNRPDAPHIIKMERPVQKAKFRNYETHLPKYKGTLKNKYAKTLSQR